MEGGGGDGRRRWEEGGGGRLEWEEEMGGLDDRLFHLLGGAEGRPLVPVCFGVLTCPSSLSHRQQLPPQTEGHAVRTDDEV